MNIRNGIEAIDQIVGKMEGDELDVMEALESLSEGWRMRAQELRDEQDEQDEF